MELEFKQYVRRPFQVEAVEITSENIDEIAKLIGTVKEEKGTKYIAIDRRIIHNIGRASIGWWVTRVNENYRCYAPLIFEELFMDHAEIIAFSFETNDMAPEVRNDLVKVALKRILEEEITSYAVTPEANEAVETGPTQGEPRGVISFSSGGETIPLTPAE